MIGENANDLIGTSHNEMSKMLSQHVIVIII